MILAVVSMHLISALISVETQGIPRALKDRAVGDYVNGQPTSFGCLQISRKVLDDVRRITGRPLWVPDVFDRATSIWICQTYLDHWATRERLGRDPTNEDRARIWNGGPDGWRKHETEEYWVKVRHELARTDDGTWQFDFRLPSDPPTVRVKIPTSRQRRGPARAQ